MRVESLFIALLLLLLAGCQVDDAALVLDNGVNDQFSAGKGIVTYIGYAPLQDKPINIHYFIPPAGDCKTMSILFVFPGTERNANDYLGAWIAEATTRNMMVFSFEFPKDKYAAADYIEGGMFKDGVEQNEKDWTFSMIDPVFEFIKQSLENNRESYDMWGHSAGAQFVTRFMLFKPNAMVNRAIAANPGWYTLPDVTKEYPYGLKGTSFANQNAQKAFFSSNLMLALGKADTVIDSNLNTSAGANAQGSNRYERGLYFWTECNRIASQLQKPLGWQKIEVAGVGHDYKKMAQATASWVRP